MFWLITIPSVLLLIILSIIIYDLIQKDHAILRNFPLVGHFRYILESIGPELRQYIISQNDEERPFTRDQRRWIYASAKKQNNYFGFGTDNDIEHTSNYVILKHSAFPYQKKTSTPKKENELYSIPCAKILGGARNRKKAFRPRSIVSVSAMSYGSLGGAAVEALNHGCKLSECAHNTGEGGISIYHQKGGELTLQIGTGYFGCRNDDGTFSMGKLVETVNNNPQVSSIEIKLSQGAKPGLGGLLPKKKITQEISEARGIPRDQDCASPSSHSAFHDVDSMLDFVESIAEQTGLPVGIKSAVGQLDFWHELATLMKDGKRGVDFIAIDGGEGGTGAAPLSFADHVSLPFKLGFSKVYAIFADAMLNEKIVFIGSAKLGFPMDALFAFGLGCDMISIAREAMLSIGCIQAQICHTGHCPAGIATHNKWLMRGLDPTLKAARFANYAITLRSDLLKLCYATGVNHPALISTDYFEILDDQLGTTSFKETFGYQHVNQSPSTEDCAEIQRIMDDLN